MKSKPRLKLFVWCEPYHVAYGSSMVFAVAETVEQAREFAWRKATSWSYGQYRQTARDWSDISLGEPTRILDLPCAEWHEWSE